MGQHLGKGHELDCRSYSPAICRHLLRARRSKGPGVPGQQDSGRTGRCSDDHIRRDGGENAAAAWLDHWVFAGEKLQNLCQDSRGQRQSLARLASEHFWKGSCLAVSHDGGMLCLELRFSSFLYHHRQPGVYQGRMTEKTVFVGFSVLSTAMNSTYDVCLKHVTLIDYKRCAPM